MPSRTGLILAGGRARRFGGEKALAPLDGRPLVRHVADAITPAVDELLVNCRPEQRRVLAAALDGLNPAFALDSKPDEGPVAGFRTGLGVATGQYAFVAGCDQPFLSPEVVDRLFARAESRSGAAPQVSDRREPLGAVYRVTDGRTACEQTLAAGSGRLFDVLERVDPVSVSVPAGFLSDIDTRADLAGAGAEWPAGSLSL